MAFTTAEKNEITAIVQNIVQGKKVPSLAAATSLVDSDVFYVVQSGVSKKVSKAVLATILATTGIYWQNLERSSGDSTILINFLAALTATSSNDWSVGSGTAGNKTITFNIGAGGNNPVFRWNGTNLQFANNGTTFVNFGTVDVSTTVLTGLTTQSPSAIAATDTILVAFGKLQAQITNISTQFIAPTYSASKVYVGGLSYIVTTGTELSKQTWLFIKATNDTGTTPGTDANIWASMGGGSLPTTTKGDIIVHNGGANDRLAVGTDGQIIVADSGQTEGIAWTDLIASLVQVTEPGTVYSPAGSSAEQHFAAINTFLGTLDQTIKLQPGTWDASSGNFPGGGTAQAGFKYIVGVAGTVDSVVFEVGDTIVAIVDNASTTTYAANWIRSKEADNQTDQEVPATITPNFYTPSGATVRGQLDGIDAELGALFFAPSSQTGGSGAASFNVSNKRLYARGITVNSADITSISFTNATNLYWFHLRFIASGDDRNIDFGSGYIFDASNYGQTDFDLEEDEIAHVIGFFDNSNWNCTLLRNQARSQQITASASMALNVNTAPYAYLNESLDAAAVNTATLNITNIKEHTENKRIGQIVFDAPDGETVNFQLNGATTNVRVVDGATASSAVLGTGTEDIFTFEYVRSNPTTVILLITQISL